MDLIHNMLHPFDLDGIAFIIRECWPWLQTHLTRLGLKR